MGKGILNLKVESSLGYHLVWLIWLAKSLKGRLKLLLLRML